jgi:hypothetical protein
LRILESSWLRENGGYEDCDEREKKIESHVFFHRTKERKRERELYWRFGGKITV